jgi:hypothetical protein
MPRFIFAAFADFHAFSRFHAVFHFFTPIDTRLPLSFSPCRRRHADITAATPSDYSPRHYYRHTPRCLFFAADTPPFALFFLISPLSLFRQRCYDISPFSITDFFQILNIDIATCHYFAAVFATPYFILPAAYFAFATD